MRNFRIVLVVVLLTSSVSGELIRDGIDIEFVTISNTGNAADTRIGEGSLGFGTVDYEYQIGKYEVTNAQWIGFVNVAGAPAGEPFNAYNDSGTIQMNSAPSSYISWYEAAQFCNYLTSGDKSHGAYLFSGNNTNAGNFLGIDRDSAVSAYETFYVIPTEDEWYKAAYYKPDGSGYSLYANGTDTLPIVGDDTNYQSVVGGLWNVGSGTEEQNGTFDIMGNVGEWNEALIWWPGREEPYRGIRGGSYGDGGHGLSSIARNSTLPPVTEFISLGFRVASIPEPATLLLLGLSGILIRKRKQSNT